MAKLYYCTLVLEDSHLFPLSHEKENMSAQLFPRVLQSHDRWHLKCDILWDLLWMPSFKYKNVPLPISVLVMLPFFFNNLYIFCWSLVGKRSLHHNRADLTLFKTTFFSFLQLPFWGSWIYVVFCFWEALTCCLKPWTSLASWSLSSFATFFSATYL